MKVEVKNIYKKFEKFTAVKNLNFVIEKNKTLGLLGPNGCGKTTSIGMMLGLITPTSGQIFINHSIFNNKNTTISDYKGKKLMIVSFLEGKAKQILTPNDCKQVGTEVARMHEITKAFKIKRSNNLSVKSWRNLFNSIKDQCTKINKDLPKLIETNLIDVEKNWPKNLPSGIIHADLFNDNIFFQDERFSGIIDFYFSCNDFYSFEIAICFNALCFDGQKNNLSFNVTKAKNFIDGYSTIRKLLDEEKESIKVLSQGAALRFLLTRVFDALNTVEGAIVKVKDPLEYLKRLEFHKNSKNFEDYFF